MDVIEFLKDRTIPQYLENVTTTLKAVFNGSSTGPLLTKETAEIALVLLNEIPEYQDRDNSYAQNSITYKDKRYNRIAALLPEKQWNDPAAFNLLVFFFGEETAAYVKHAWEKIPYQMYQVGYARRSFRAPNDPEVYFVLQLEFLRMNLPLSHAVNYYPKLAFTAYNLSLEEQIRYSHGLHSEPLFRIWAAAIDLGNDTVFTTLENIIFNKDTEGRVSRPMIKALLNSEKTIAWELVEKLLLAAQRQEGLRQIVLEALDETSVGALKYMVKVVLDNKLTRFSSVVRAVDVWAGLGWEAEKEGTIKTFLEKAQEYLTSPEGIPAALKSKNNTEVYMALWAQGVYNVEETRPLLIDMLETGSSEKKCLALKFAAETRYYNIDVPLAEKALEDEDLAVVGMALSIINARITTNAAYYDQYFPALFDKLHAVIKRAPEKEKVFEGKVFSWMNIKFDRNDAMNAMIYLIMDKQERLDIVLGYFDEMNITLRELVARLLLPGFSPYSGKGFKAPEVLTAFQRSFAMRLLKDRGEYVVNTAFKALHKEHFTVEEMELFTDILKRKSATIRSQTISLIVRQEDIIVAPVTEKLLLQGDAEQRLGGLDIALHLHKANRLAPALKGWISTFKERKNISQKEEILLSQLEEDSSLQSYTAENGYGLYDPAAISPIILPPVNPDDYYGQCIAAGAYGLSVTPEAWREAMTRLQALFQEHAAYEYEAESYNNTTETLLLGNAFMQKVYNRKFESPEEAYASYPLPEVWEQWYQQSGLTPRDLYIFQSLAREKRDIEAVPEAAALMRKYLPTYEELLPAAQREKYPYHWTNPLLKIISALTIIHPFTQRDQFLTGACIRVFNALTPEQLAYRQKMYYGDAGWQDVAPYNVFLELVPHQQIGQELVADVWNLHHWRQFSGIEENIARKLPPLSLFCRAFGAGLISESEMYRGLLSAENMRGLSNHSRKRDTYDFFGEFPFLEAMFVKTRERLLDIELKRGDSPTPVTCLAQVLDVIYGVNRFAEIWAGLGKTSLNRGYIYAYNDNPLSKQQVFSILLKHCHPLPEDTQEGFDEQVKKIKLTESQLIEAAVYAPQWQKFVSGNLGWKGLDSAIWWMHAHTKSSGSEQNAEAESEIARYSAVDLQDFKDGAVDKEWFVQAYKELGKQRWPIVYDAAKYISDGNAHRRARLYADVITGELKIKEVTQKVKEKRDQDYLRLYGLIPLSKTNADKDVLSRYEYLQQFKKESKQFGAQKQSSEALALRIAMENLARNAGYADPIRLTWAMETRQVQTILSKETQVQFDDVLIGLIIDEEGQADVVAFKGDKQLKAIPPKYKNDKKVQELNEFKKVLKEQFRRSRKALEDAMVRGDVFSFAEISSLFGHPVITKHLENLVFVTDHSHGFYRSAALCDAAGNITPLTDKDSIRIAHCSDLYATGAWSSYQHYCFEKKIQQPFKQIFRELYLPLADELKEKSVSRRYAGHQVQPSQTVALLKARGWKVDYEQGLQKVFHQQGFVAKIYAMADWFSPADVESPTLETIIFHDLKTYKPVAFETISPLIFSEVMRDLDLVVSVAHAGGVDPEASHSSIEMRSVLLQETLRLFKLNNVTVKGSHAIIQGKLGEYSVHLGSAVVHQLPGKYLSILPVHSQHRGRIFLPFADDDPRSAELISKVLLLARDHEIQDPTVLQQIA